MTIDLEMQKRWILGEPVPPTTFRMCQSVHVVAGPHSGEHGELISLFALDPEPVYHLETSNNEDSMSCNLTWSVTAPNPASSVRLTAAFALRKPPLMCNVSPQAAPWRGPGRLGAASYPRSQAACSVCLRAQ